MAGSAKVLMLLREQATHNRVSVRDSLKEEVSDRVKGLLRVADRERKQAREEEEGSEKEERVETDRNV